MNSQHEKIVREFCDAWGDGSREHPDKAKILALMSDDATWEVWVPGGSVLRGRQEISDEIDRHIPLYSHLKCDIKTIVGEGRKFFTERVDSYRSSGRNIEFRLVAVFEINGDGKIYAWREYFDMGSVLKNFETN